MEQFSVQKIGVFKTDELGTRIELCPGYADALEGLEGFGHLQILWWFSNCDDAQSRSTRQEASPYRHGPKTLGTFATRSPLRPNPIALSCVQVTLLDRANGVVWITYTDAEAGTPVLDIKPYTPSLDRVEAPTVPTWCSHWPTASRRREHLIGKPSLISTRATGA